MPTIGRATIDVDYDGKGMPAQARRIGEEAGDGFGDEFNKAYPKKLDEGFKRQSGEFQKRGEKDGQTYGKAYSSGVRKDLDSLAEKVASVFRDKNGLENYRQGMFGVRRETGQVTKATTVLRGEIAQLDKAGRLGDVSMKTLTDRLTVLGREERSIETKHINELFRSSREAMKQQDEWAASNERFRKTGLDLKQLLRDQANDQRELSRMERDGAKAAREIESAMGDVDRAFLKLNPKVERNHEAFRKLSDISKSGGTAGEFRTLAREAEGLAKSVERVGANAVRAGSNAGKSTGGFSKLGGAFRVLSQFDPGDNIGQLFLLIIALAPSIAVLANAAAGGLLILAGAIAAIGAAGVGYGFVFSNLFGDLKKVDPAVRPAAKALQDFGKTFGDLRTNLQKQVLTPAVISQFEQFSSKLAGTLQSGFAKIGPALNQVLLGVSRDLNSAGFKKDFDKLFASFAPTIKSFGGVLRNTFGIVGELLTQAAPYVQRFVSELDKATGKFLTFLKSPEGKTAVKDFLDNATRTLKDVGDAIVVVADGFVKMITPTNVARTTKLLQELGATAAGLLKVGDALGDINAAFEESNGGSYLDEVVGEIEGIGEAFEGLFTGLGNAKATLAGFFLGVQNQINTFVGAVQTAFSGVGKAFSQALKGDFVGAAATLKTTFDKGVQSARDFKTNLAGALGDAGALFRGLDTQAQTNLLKLAGRFDVPKSKSQEFGGEIARLAGAAGVDINKIATAKSWGEIGTKLGLTGTQVKDLSKRFGELPAVKSTKVEALNAEQSAAKVKDLDKQIKGLKDKVVKAEEEGASPSSKRVVDLQNKIKALQSKKIDVKEQGAADSASRARILKEKVDALKAKTIQVNETGAKASSDRAQTLKNKVDALKAKTIQVAESGASASSGRVQTLTGKINVLKGKSVSVVANVAGAAAVGALAGAIGALRDKTVNVRTIQSTRNANRYGGVMQAGRQIAGGERIRGDVMAYAKGGILRRPTFFGNVLAGEAGPEAIVPLSGSLAKVDKSVRDLSAIARGRAQYVPAGAGGGKTVHVAEGAIQVNSPSASPKQVGDAVLDRLAIAVGSD